MLRFLSLNIHNLHLKAIHNDYCVVSDCEDVEIPLAQYTQFTFESNSQLNQNSFSEPPWLRFLSLNIHNLHLKAIHNASSFSSSSSVLRFLSLNIHNLHLKAIHNAPIFVPIPGSVEIPLAQYTQFTFESNSQRKEQSPLRNQS